MTRITKDPNIRREELIDIAEELFLKNGYEETPISEIVEKAQIARGTFYYYFPSKEELLDAVMVRYLDGFVRSFKEQIQKEVTAVEKMINIFATLAQFSYNRERLIGFIHQEKNALLHLKIEKKGYPLVIPLFAEIIEQGIKEGVFNTRYPRVAALAVLTCQHALIDPEQFFKMATAEKKRAIEAVLDVVERIIGTKPGTLAGPFLDMAGFS